MDISDFILEHSRSSELLEKSEVCSHHSMIASLLGLRFQNEFYAPIEDSVSEIVITKDENEDVADETSFEVFLGDSYESVEPFWLVNGEIVLNQKCYQKSFLETRYLRVYTLVSSF